MHSLGLCGCWGAWVLLLGYRVWLLGHWWPPASRWALGTHCTGASPSPTVHLWGTEEVASWLEHLSLCEYKDIFTRHDIRGSELLHLERRDLKVLPQPLLGPAWAPPPSVLRPLPRPATAQHGVVWGGARPPALTVMLPLTANTAERWGPCLVQLGNEPLQHQKPCWQTRPC